MAGKVHGIASGDKFLITIVGCGNAAGQTILPPMVIFKGERFNHEWSVGEVPGTLYGMSKKGWIDQELRPVLLLLVPTILLKQLYSKAAESGVVVLCISPNTTHVALFGPLKSHWGSVCHSYLANNPGCVVIKLKFSSLFSKAWIKAIKLSMAFRKQECVPSTRMLFLFLTVKLKLTVILNQLIQK